MLRETKVLLAERGRMTLRELAIHFDMDVAAIEPMLQTLVDKGQIEVYSGCGQTCGGCTAACREDMVAYALVDA